MPGALSAALEGRHPDGAADDRGIAHDSLRCHLRQPRAASRGRWFSEHSPPPYGSQTDALQNVGFFGYDLTLQVAEGLCGPAAERLEDRVLLAGWQSKATQPRFHVPGLDRLPRCPWHCPPRHHHWCEYRGTLLAIRGEELALVLPSSTPL